LAEDIAPPTFGSDYAADRLTAMESEVRCLCKRTHERFEAQSRDAAGLREHRDARFDGVYKRFTMSMWILGGVPAASLTLLGLILQKWLGL